MARGKANPALLIVVWADWLAQPEIVALREAGHRIYGWLEPCPPDVDLILHPAAHAWSESMWDTPYLKAALTAARKRNRERKKANG